MGNLNVALSLIIEKLGDVKQAIAFVEDHKDEQVWRKRHRGVKLRGLCLLSTSNNVVVDGGLCDL